MPKRVRITYQGEPVEGEEIDFEPLREQWNEYRLSDGTLLRMKLVIAKVLRLDKRNEAGEPIYVINSQNVVSVSVPPELMR